MNAYISHGWADKIVDPDRKNSQLVDETVGASVSSSPSSELSAPEDAGAYKPLKKIFPWHSSTGFQFTNAEIINSFVSGTVVDGLPASDVKGMRTSASNLFWCGHPHTKYCSV